MQVHERWTVKSIARKPTRPMIKANQVMVIDPTYVATIRATTGRTSARRAAPGSASRHGANESALFHPDVVESGSSVESDRPTRQERTVAAERLLTLGSSFETTRQPPWETVSHLSRLGVARAAQSALAQCYWR